LTFAAERRNNALVERLNCRYLAAVLGFAPETANVVLRKNPLRLTAFLMLLLSRKRQNWT
jgi:hypothetical protein